jgi:26S proteasome regulatory subunit N1
MSDQKNDKKDNNSKDNKDKKDKKDEFGFKKDEEETKIDKEEKEKYEMYVERLQDVELDIRRRALEEIKREVSTATSSMTSVPKPLKYLRPHYDELKKFYDEKCEGIFKQEVADLMSVLAITMSEKGTNECLKYALAGTKRNLIDWGNEYLRSLSGEISAEYNERLKNDESTDELNFFVDIIAPF